MTTPQIPSVVAELRKRIQAQQAELFLLGYRVRNRDSGEVEDVFYEVDPADYHDLWTQWRSQLAQYAPPIEPEVRTRADAFKALDSLLRRLEDLFGPVPVEQARETWAALDLDLPVGKGDSSSPETSPPKKHRRSTEKDEARTKIIAALTKHHKYAKGSCLNQEPIGNNELADKAEVSKSSASRFFKEKFKGRSKYLAICKDASRLVGALKMLNNEFSPHILYGDRPSETLEKDLHDRHDDE
ncbi:MAG TPA: hypothetical protein VEL76_04180 [Gemmataceae bacterium]|nr:hypothetical protein [Gemmataceae bacterium]